MTDKLFAERIARECMTGDPDADHMKADELLLELLRRLGYTETITAYEAVLKWYS